MVKKILWTETAMLSLKLIFDFYKDNIDLSVAKKIKRKILKDINTLQSGTFLTSKEPSLQNFSKEYRFLVSGNHKIIYFVEKKDIIISLVFDSRQNPQKMIDLIISDNL